jgi:hypothetical protein
MKIIPIEGVNVLDQYLSPHVNAYHADCIEGVRALPANCADVAIFSPPFSGRGRDLFVYSASDRDIGNNRGDDVFEEHMAFLAPAIFRALKPGRMCAIHCMDIQLSLTHHGVIGFFDFPGQLVRTYEAAGFIYYGRITIWKDPVIAEQRTHARNLVHHLMCADSAMSSVGLPDYVLLMRKPGENAAPIRHTDDALGTKGDDGKPAHWQQVASPVWEPPGDLVWATSNGLHADGFAVYESPRTGNPDKRGIEQGDTLNVRSAKAEDDERHICPLQLGVYERLLSLYTNPGEVLLEPFGGIGSGAFTAIKMGRRAVTFELKPEYYKQLVANVRSVEPGASGQQTSLLDRIGQQGTCKECGETDSIGTCACCGGVVV